MSEFKNISNEEKVTHYLAGELSSEEKAEFELALKKDPALAKEFSASQSLISLMSVDKNSLVIEGGIGVERKNKIFGNQNSKTTNKKDSRIIDVFKHLKFTLVAAALVLLSYAFLPELWKSSNTSGTKITEPKSGGVLGVRTFNMALPSGTFQFTVKDNFLNVDKIETTDGNDYFKMSKVQVGDQILMIDGKEIGSFKSDELSSYLLSLTNKTDVILQIRRNGHILPSNNTQP